MKFEKKSCSRYNLVVFEFSQLALEKKRLVIMIE